MNKVYVIYPEEIGTISKNIYSHFVQPIAHSVYEGIWVGEDSPIPNTRGIRNDLIEKLRQIHPGAIRWPGGSNSNTFDWKDGIGPREKRPTRISAAYCETGDVENNQFGTHEFMDFCHLIGAEPYLTPNLLTKELSNLLEWIEYCNVPAGVTTLSKLRETNGASEPFNVKYWGMGNEPTLGGGMMTPQNYCDTYCRMVGGTHVVTRKQDTFFVASGPIWNDTKWSRAFFEDYNKRCIGWEAEHLDGYALHRYCICDGHDDDFNAEQWYNQLKQTEKVDELIRDHRTILNEYDATHHVKLILDEWGSWTSINNVPVKEGETLFHQPGTMRDAMVAALNFNIFNNNCDIVEMTNITCMVNYLHSLFLISGDKLVTTPTYHVFDMYKEHQNAKAVRTVCVSDSSGDVKTISSSCSVKNGKTLLTLTNADFDKPQDVIIELHEQNFPGAIQVTTLAASEPHLHNTFEQPDNVVPTHSQLTCTTEKLTITMPPASITSLTF